MTNGEDGERQYSDDKRIVHCAHCGAVMLGVEGMRKVCRDCQAKLNQAVSLKEELAEWERQKAAWMEEERRMYRNKEVG